MSSESSPTASRRSRKVFLCTLGTSIASKPQHLRDQLFALQKKTDGWTETDKDFESALLAYVRSLVRDSGAVAESCAETSVLVKAEARAGDRVILLATDTGLGHCCGDAVRTVLVKGMGLDENDVELVPVEGLQVFDAERLRSTGLKNFLSVCINRIQVHRNQGDEVLLCPLGGYKGIVPFLTVLGMLFRCPVLYTFERVEALIRLPPLPVSFNEGLYLRAKDALLELGEKVEMPEREWLSRIKGFQPEERDEFLAFVEPSILEHPGFVSPSSFLEALAPQYHVTTSPVSPKALQDLESLAGGSDYAAACRMIVGAQDKMFRKQWTHKKIVEAKTDLIVLKQGSTNIRVMGFLLNERFYVCRVFTHDDYDQQLDHRKIVAADFPVDSFTEWNPTADNDGEPGSGESTSPYEDALQECERLRKETQEKQEGYLRQIVELRAQTENFEKERTGMARRISAQQDELVRLRDERRKWETNMNEMKKEQQQSFADTSALVAEARSLKQEKLNLEQRLRKSLFDAEDANRKISAERERNLALQTDLESTKSQVRETQDLLAAVQTENGTLQAQLADARAKLQSLRTSFWGRLLLRRSRP